MVIRDWKSYPPGKEKYGLYLASREWAVRKNAVHARAGGKCEHCKHADATETHHITYERTYNEPLTDLLAVCSPCHRFLSAKSNHDPRLSIPISLYGRTVKSVYLAGKIEGGDKRVKDWRPVDQWEVLRCYGWGSSFKGAVKLSDGRSLDYVGPFISDWGGHSIPAHGCGDSISREPDPDIPGRCFDAIQKADFVFAWINCDTCYGTVAEIGIAAALGKLILIAGTRPFPELWFSYSFADALFLEAKDPATALDFMVLHCVGNTFAEITDRDWNHGQSQWQYALSHEPEPDDEDFDDEDRVWLLTVGSEESDVD